VQIQPQFQSLGNLFNARLFRIPEYQRAYSWQPKQRQDLFLDIQKVHKSGSDSDHFMATIVGLRRKKRSIAAIEYTEIEVVDGQQRLTTLTILLKAISKALNRSDKTERKRAEEIDGLLVKGDDLSLLLLQTNQDTSHIFVDYLREGSIPSEQAIVTAADRNLVRAISECESFVKTWAQVSAGTMIDLLGIIRNRLSVIFHEIEDEALVYTVFEVLNSRGLDVTWFDKLKSLLMAMLFEECDDGAKPAAVKELHALWTDIYQTIGLRQNLNRETLRFASTLRSAKSPNRPIDEERAVQQLTEQCSNNPKKVIDCTKWLLKVVRAEDRLLANQRLTAASDISQARLVAVAVFIRGFAPNDEETVLRHWENVTFRIYSLAGRDARTKVGDYVRLAWRIVNESMSAVAVVEELGKIGVEFPIKGVIKNLHNSDRYQGWSHQLRYFMFRYEEHLAAMAGQKLNESQWNKIWADEPSKSVEHIRPRSKGSEDPATRAIFVHRLGNLLMLPPGVNSKLQDKDPKDKAVTYQSCGLLQAMEVGRLVRKRKWDRSAVEKRERRLIRWAPSEWGD
jgi:hypothetical protein